MVKKMYEQPQLDLLSLGCRDVIIMSGGTPYDNGNDNELGGTELNLGGLG